MNIRNPKILAGCIGAVILTILLGIVIARMVPTIGEVRREMSLTPTPLPAMPASVRAVTGAPGMPTPVPPLTSGSQGERVWALQERLQALGYYTGTVDGQFGPGTRDAVTAFQRKNGLEPDGMAGEETLKKLTSPEALPAE